MIAKEQKRDIKNKQLGSRNQFVCQGTGTWHEPTKRLGEDIFFPGRLAFRAMLSKNAIF